MISIDFTSLAGRSVLVRSTVRRPDLPPIMRGTLQVREGGGPEAGPCVHLILSGSNAATDIPLDEYALKQLLASEQQGQLEFSISPSLD